MARDVAVETSTVAEIVVVVSMAGAVPEVVAGEVGASVIVETTEIAEVRVTQAGVPMNDATVVLTNNKRDVVPTFSSVDLN